MRRTLLSALAAASLVLATPILHPQTPASEKPSNLVEIDASTPAGVPETGFLHMGGRSSNGHDLEINSRYLTLDGKPWLPIMGEFHFTRYPEQYWEEEILKMKAAGIQVISTYVFWIHHEEIEGQFDWTGRRDLHHFVELCGRNGIYVYLRPGPWAHGEVRNGGLPDWLVNQPKMRTNDPAYMAHVERFFDQIGIQVKGQLWKDGGPIIGVQLENEYSEHGAGRGAEHIAALKTLAQKAGIDVPLYSVTGWPSLDFPPHDVIPMSGGYPDGFWYGSKTNLPPSPVYLFNLNRKLGDMGATSPSEDPTGKVDLRHDPYFGAEEAGGMATAYHRRPLLQADDIAALTLTGIGSGLNLYGYYMFQGGANPAGKRTTMQESSATAYPNDLPQINYDFQAPLGQYGQVRESYRKTRAMHLFLNSFGAELAPMVAVGSPRTPQDAADSSVPRVTVRSNGRSGFVFVNNYVRQLTMPQRPEFQVHIKLAGREAMVPKEPLNLPADSYFIWPFNLPMGDATLLYSTAQLLTKMDGAGGPTYFFFAVGGVAPEFSFDEETTKVVTSPGGRVTSVGKSIQVTGLQPGIDAVIRVTSKAGSTATIVLLTAAQAESCISILVRGHEHVVLTTADVFVSGDALHLRSTDQSDLTLAIFPALALAGAQALDQGKSMWATYRFSQPAVKVATTLKKVHDAEVPPPSKMGPYLQWRKGSVPLVPGEEAWKGAAEWAVELPKIPMQGLSDAFLNIHYAGDIARLYLNGHLVDDNFFNGAVWQVGLKRFGPGAFLEPLRIKVFPLAADAPIYLDASARAKLGSGSQTGEIDEVSISPEYEVTVPLDAIGAKRK